MDNNNTTKEGKKQQLRAKLAAMQNARRGKCSDSEVQRSAAGAATAIGATSSISKKNQRKTKKMVQSSQMEEVLKKFGINDDGTRKALQRAIQSGSLSTLEELAKFISECAKRPVTANDLISAPSATGNQSQPHPSQQSPDSLMARSAMEATEFLGGDSLSDNNSKPTTTTRPKMQPPRLEF